MRAGRATDGDVADAVAAVGVEQGNGESGGGHNYVVIVVCACGAGEGLFDAGEGIGGGDRRDVRDEGGVRGDANALDCDSVDMWVVRIGETVDVESVGSDV